MKAALRGGAGGEPAGVGCQVPGTQCVCQAIWDREVVGGLGGRGHARRGGTRVRLPWQSSMGLRGPGGWSATLLAVPRPP